MFDLDFKEKGTIFMQITWPTVTDNTLASQLPKATQLPNAAHARGVWGHAPPGKFLILLLFRWHFGPFWNDFYQ